MNKKKGFTAGFQCLICYRKWTTEFEVHAKKFIDYCISKQCLKDHEPIMSYDTFPKKPKENPRKFDTLTNQYVPLTGADNG